MGKLEPVRRKLWYWRRKHFIPLQPHWTV